MLQKPLTLLHHVTTHMHLKWISHPYTSVSQEFDNAIIIAVTCAMCPSCLTFEYVTVIQPAVVRAIIACLIRSLTAGWLQREPCSCVHMVRHGVVASRPSARAAALLACAHDTHLPDLSLRDQSDSTNMNRGLEYLFAFSIRFVSLNRSRECSLCSSDFNPITLS